MNPTSFSLIIFMIIKLSRARELLCNKDQVFLNGECKNQANFHSKCISTRMCRTKNAICLDENNKEHNYNPNQLDIERESYCQCPFRYEFNHQKDECVFFRKFCSTDNECEKNYKCDLGQCKCLYENHDKEKYYTYCLHQEINVVTCIKDPIRTICTNHTQRFDLPDPFMINQTWSTMLWKLSFLTVFLILLMLLIKGVLRARQNEDYLNWARTIAMHHEAVRNENNVHRSNREISVNMQSDSPPTYSEAIKMNCQDRDGRQTQTSI